MFPQVPPGSQTQPAENAPGSFVQINNFPDGTYVSNVPQIDEIDKVFKPVKVEEVSVKLTVGFSALCYVEDIRTFRYPQMASN